MENEFEVEVWTYIGNHKKGETSIADYQWNTEYSGDDKVQAFYVMEELKRKGAKCVKITWR